MAVGACNEDNSLLERTTRSDGEPPDVPSSMLYRS